LVYPLSNLVATQQVETGDYVLVDYNPETKTLVFRKQSGKMIVSEQPEEESDEGTLAIADAAGMPLPQASAAPQMSKSKGENTDVA
jgi:hypothetical protein